MIIGIDLGTTNSLAARLTENGPRLIPNSLGDVLTPSVVGFGSDNKLLVGRAAKELQVTQPERCASLFKRHMGSDHAFELAGRSFAPEKLSSLVLRSLREDAEAYLGSPVAEAVVTVPAYFNDNQRKATVAAGEIAGLVVKRILNEPTAAAMAYGLHDSHRARSVLVLDLGGGTFDASVVEVFEGMIEVRASSGESFLGGEDFTRAMASKILTEQGLIYERAELHCPKMVSRLTQQCEVAKLELTTESEARVRLPDKDGILAPDGSHFVVTREMFEKWTKGILTRIELPIRRVLGDSGLKRTEIDEVILVGGATRMPCVTARVAELFEAVPHSRLNPDEVVARGAAIQAGLIGRASGVDDLVVTDVAPFTLGIMIVKQIGPEIRDGYFLPIIDRNTTIPVTRVDRVTTVYSNQTEICVKIYQGEGRRVENSLLLGEFSLRGIPPGPAGQEVDIRFTYDLNGILEVEATVVKTGLTVTHVVTRHAKRLSAREIEKAVVEMQAIKRHPREESVNRHLMRRAERIYQEMSLAERDRLGDLMDGFESAMESRDQAAIAEYQRVLADVLDRWESGLHGNWSES